MSRRDIQQLLQECLEGYDGGLTPDECLSAYPPEARVELEPLLRQALSLRVAYAAAPDPDYKSRVREKLLFAAGRDVTQAFTAEPDPGFVRATRQRLLNTAGAGAQEALRDVPPPRLPFWVNARRRLLETAQAGPPPPAHAGVIGLRTALSAAVVVLAVAIAGAGFFLQDSPANRSTQLALSAELEYINQRVTSYEQLQARGQIVPPTEIDDLVELAERTSKLAELYSDGNAELLDRLPSLIDRQQSLQQSLISEESSLEETLAVAQARLDEADQRVAAADPTNEPEATSTPDVPAAIVSTPEPTTEPTSEPTAEATATPDIPDIAIISPEDLGPDQLVMQFNEDEKLLDLRWWQVTTNTLTFLMPEAWTIANVETQGGLAVVLDPYLLVETDLGLTLAVSRATGEVTVLNSDPLRVVRSAGIDGEPLPPQDLVELTGIQQNWAALFNMLRSVGVVDGAAADATPEATVTPVATSDSPVTDP